MGQDKALASHQGRPLICHVLDVLASVFPEMLIIGREPGWLWESVNRAEGRVRCVPDRLPGLGPLGGLATALYQAGGRPVFLAGCDMPHLRAGAVELVIARLDGFQAAVPLVNGYLQPLHAAYTPGCLPAVEELLGAGRLSMMGLLDRLTVHTVREEDLRAVDPDLQSTRSVNRPGDLDGLITITSPVQSAPDSSQARNDNRGVV